MTLQRITAPVQFPILLPETNEQIRKSSDCVHSRYCVYSQFPTNLSGGQIAGVWAGMNPDPFCLTWEKSLILLRKISTAYGLCFLLLDSNLVTDWHLTFSLLDSMNVTVFVYGSFVQWQQASIAYEEVKL